MTEEPLKEINLDDVKPWTEKEWFEHISEEYDEFFGNPLVLEVSKIPLSTSFKWLAAAYLGDITASVANAIHTNKKTAIGNLNAILDNILGTIQDMEDCGFLKVIKREKLKK